MLSVRKDSLERGIYKVVTNGLQLLQLASMLRSRKDLPSNSVGYGVALTHMGLEELAKASFLFAKYLDASLPPYRTTISNEERNKWFAGNQAHAQKTRRINHLYGLLSQVTDIPGTSVIFPQGVEELLKNRNAGFYVDYSHTTGEFESPGEGVSTNIWSTISSVVKDVYTFCRYDLALDYLKRSKEINVKNKRQAIRTIFTALEEKKLDVQKEVEDMTRDHPHFGRGARVDYLFCAYPLYHEDQNCVEIMSTILITSTTSEAFFTDNLYHRTIIYPTGNIKQELCEIPEDIDLYLQQRTEQFLENAEKWLAKQSDQ